MEESNIRICKRCEEPKQRIQDGKFPNGVNKRWIDDTGKQWSGNLCGTCNNDRVRESLKRKRRTK